MRVLLFCLLFSFSAVAQDAGVFKDSDIERTLKDGSIQKFDGDKYMIVPRVKKKKKKKVVKTTKVVEKQKVYRNRLSFLGGYGSLGNLKVSGTEARTENGVVLGIQYMRDFKDDKLHLLIQVQTNETVQIGGGVRF